MISFRAATRDDRSLALVLAAGAASLAAALPFVRWFAPFAPGCVFHALTGVPCPACGTTRAMLALGRGDVAAALGWNPLATFALLFGAAVCALAPVWLLAGRSVPVLGPGLPKWAKIALLTAVAANWAWLITKGV